MGLAIHYRLKSDADSPAPARQQVEKLRQAALDLPMAEVGEVREFLGDDCDFRTALQDSHGLALLHAHRLTPVGGTCQFLMPNHVIAFPVLPGDGCDGASFGLARYPAAIESKGGTAETGLHGWSWQAFCKTEYASNPKFDGIANFLRCHLSIIRLLDEAQEMGLLERVRDEGRYGENRDAKALAETVGRWNSLLAALVGLFFKSPELRKELAEMDGAGTVSAEQTPSGNRAVSVHGRIQNGVVVLQRVASLPEGAEVTVVLG